MINKFGPLKFDINYKYTGKFIDWDGSKNSSQKSTDLVDLTVKKNINGNFIWSKILDCSKPVLFRPYAIVT